MPTIAGNALAAFVLCELAGSPISDTHSRDPITVKQRRKMTDSLREIFGLTAREFDEKISAEALELIFSKFRGRSAFSDYKNGLIFTAWRKSDYLDERNILLATRAEADQHFRMGFSDEDNLALYGDLKCSAIEDTLRL